MSLHVNNQFVMNFVNRAGAELVVDLYIYKVFFKVNVVIYQSECSVVWN